MHIVMDIGTYICTIVGIPNCVATGVKFNSLRHILPVEVVKLEKGAHIGQQNRYFMQRVLKLIFLRMFAEIKADEPEREKEWNESRSEAWGSSTCVEVVITNAGCNEKIINAIGN